MAIDFSFDDTSQIFNVVNRSQWNAGIDFGYTGAFSTSVRISPAQMVAIDKAVLEGGSLFASGLIPPSIAYSARITVKIPKKALPSFSEADFKQQFTVGFIQGIAEGDLYLLYWGKTKTHGRSWRNITNPKSFEVDTSSKTKPWTNLDDSYLVKKLQSTSSDFHEFSVFQENTDHPIYRFQKMVPYKIPDKPGVVNTPPVRHYLRFARVRRDFRSIFCIQEKSTKLITPISSIKWSSIHNHQITYVQMGAGNSMVVTPTVTGPRGLDAIPETGLRSNIDLQDRQITKMAEGAGPFLTPEIIDQRVNSESKDSNNLLNFFTQELENPDFDPTFWVTK
jgi:hypothetical protein